MSEASGSDLAVVPRRWPRLRRLVGRGLGLYPILGVVLVWELVSRTGQVSAVLLPAFSTVVRRTVSMTLSGELPNALAITAGRAAAGLVIGVAAGTVVGFAMARSRPLRWFFEPVIAVGFPTPTITLLPVFILWFGTQHLSKVLLVAVSCFFPIALSAFAGASQVSPRLIWSAQAMGTRGHQLFRRVIVPASTTFLFAGLRVAVPVAVIITVLSEMIGGGGGLGFRLVFGYRFLDTPMSFAALLTVLVFGLIVDRCLLWARAVLLPWEESERSGVGGAV